MLEWTGERFLPWIKESTIAYEHLHRYAYAATLVENKRVLDLACGEGYGSKMLASKAAAVTGVDIDAASVQHAIEKYGSPNLRFLTGSITAIPIEDDHSFDAVVCYEAIEHIEDQASLLSEVKRLLKPDGLFIVSTPNKAIYHDEAPEENPFHVRELYFEEFRDLLAKHFRKIQFLGQRIHPSSSIWPISKASVNGYREFVIDRADADFEFIDAQKRVPLYFIALAADAESALPPGSVLVDDSDGLLKEKQRELEWLDGQITDRNQTIKSLEEAMKWREQQIEDREQQIEELTKGLEWMRNDAAALQKTISELKESIASQEEALKWRAQQVEELGAAKTFWERESAALTTQLQDTRRQLAFASDTLAGIYASRGWKLIMKLRGIRDGIKGLGKSRG